MTRLASVTAARTALAAAPRFAGFKALNIWAKSINAGDLPMIGVGSPGATVDDEGLDSTSRTIRLIVVIKRAGANLETLADADEAAAEIAVIGGVTDARLLQTDYSEDSTGSAPVSTLTLQFAVSAWLAEPLA